MTLDVDVVRLSPNHSPGQPSGKKVVVHATRSGVSMNPSEFDGTLNYFARTSSQVSAHGLVGRDGRIARIVPDSQTAWHAAIRYPDGRVIEHNTTCWGWELEQGVESDGFTIKQMESWAEVGRYYVEEFGVEPQHITDINESGFIGHEETPQGISVGKSDPGAGFMWRAFIASLEEDMSLVNANGAIYALGAMGKRHIGPTEYAGWRAMGFTAAKVSKADLDKLPDWDDKVAATVFKPTGHPGAALKTWIASYNTHRHSTSGSGNSNHVQVRASVAKLRADTAKYDTALRNDLSDHEDDSGQHEGGGGLQRGDTVRLE